jgi:hypothetical protein
LSSYYLRPLEKPEQLCVICSEHLATTVDHVPPKGIFPRPRPSDLITVPACAACNNEASNLDEAFKLYLGLHVGPFEDPATDKFFAQAQRTFQHNRRLQRELLGQAAPIPFIDEEGESTGEGLAVRWNSDAHDKKIERVVRGLHFHHFGKSLSPDTVVAPKWFREPHRNFLPEGLELASRTIGEKQFSYSFARVEEQPQVSIWTFEFYERHWSGALTSMPIDQSDPQLKSQENAPLQRSK